MDLSNKRAPKKNKRVPLLLVHTSPGRLRSKNLKAKSVVAPVGPGSCINFSGGHFRPSVLVTAFYDAERKGIGFVCYPRQVGDGVSQVFMVRIPRKMAFPASGDGHQQVLVCLLSCYETVVLGRNRRVGEGCRSPRARPPGREEHVAQSSYRCVPDRGIVCPLGSTVPECEAAPDYF